MKLSIVTVNRNNAAGLVKTLSSTFGDQPGFSDWEQIVVDGASTDGSFATVDRYRADPHLGWCVSEPDKGIYNAMNKGAAHARGDYLLFLNSGDSLMPGALEAVGACGGFSGDVAYGSAEYVRTDGSSFVRKLPEPREITPAFFLFAALSHQACFISRELHERLGGYDESLKIVADTKFFLEAVSGASARLNRVPVTVARFEMGGVSSNPAHAARRWNEREKMLIPFFGSFVAHESTLLRRTRTTWIDRSVAEMAAEDAAMRNELRMATSCVASTWNRRFARRLLGGVLRAFSVAAGGSRRPSRR